MQDIEFVMKFENDQASKAFDFAMKGLSHIHKTPLKTHVIDIQILANSLKDMLVTSFDSTKYNWNSPHINEATREFNSVMARKYVALELLSDVSKQKKDEKSQKIINDTRSLVSNFKTKNSISKKISLDDIVSSVNNEFSNFGEPSKSTIIKDIEKLRSNEQTKDTPALVNPLLPSPLNTSPSSHVKTPRPANAPQHNHRKTPNHKNSSQDKAPDHHAFSLNDCKKLIRPALVVGLIAATAIYMTRKPTIHKESAQLQLDR